MGDGRPAHVRPRLAVWLIAVWAAACGNAAHDAPPDGQGPDHAVILLYHHVAADTPASTSVNPATFDAHLDYLAEHDYRVVALSRIIAALRDGEPLPPRAVAITFDDAYESVYTEAAPRLERRGYPYAVFVSTDYLDKEFGHYASWQQLRELEARGAEIANHSRSHAHLVHRGPEESTQAWRQRVRDDLEAAQQRLEAELTAPLRALAYPYGEFDPALTRLAGELGFTAFGQQSGPVGHASDLQALPRFPMAASYAELPKLAEKLRTLPFDVSVLAPDDPILAPDSAAPTLRLRLTAPGARLDALSCFVTGQQAPRLDWLNRTDGVVAVTARRPLPVGRSKYTCTAPARGREGIFYWYSHLWMKPPAAGEWYRD